MATRSKKMTKKLALLRGANVGGKCKLTMRELVEIFAEAGCAQIKTYIQSGNVVFCSERDADTLERSLANRIEERFGFRTVVILRTAAEMREVLRRNPFEGAVKNNGLDQKNLHVLFLKDVPTLESVQKLNPERYAPDRFSAQGQNVYLLLPNGVARTKLTNAYFESRLSTVSTARNWNTVQKLCQMLEEPD